MLQTIRFLATAFALVTGVLTAEASAAELKVLSFFPLRAALQELAPAFEAASGHKLKIDYATAGVIEEKIAAGDEIDVVILGKSQIDKLVREAKVVGGTTQTLARAQVGLAVKKGAPKPDISSVETFKKALLDAKSVAYADPASGAASGQHLVKVIEKLGIAAELKPKTRLISAPAGAQAVPVGEAVERGEAEVGIHFINLMMAVPGIEIVGPLPAELQSDLAYIAGSPFFSEQPIAAKALIDFLAGPKAAAVYKAKGLQPG
jgi:molybdate transport system substrate-binding protein